MTYERIGPKDQWIVDDQGEVTGVRISGKNTELSGIVTSSRNPLTGGVEVSANGKLVGQSFMVPLPTGDLAVDHAAITAFFDAAPNNAVITFPMGVVYTLYGGAIRHKPGQIVNYNNSTIKRANEIVTTSSGAITYGASLSFPVASTAGLLVGQAIGINGTKAGGNSMIAWDCRITSIVGNVVTCSNSSQFINLTLGTNVTDTILSGATIVTKGALIDSESLMSGTTKEIIKNIIIDGNVANNGTANRWEYCSEIKFRTKSGVLENTEINNACGEGVVVWGDNPQINNFRGTNLNGNGIHFNAGCNDCVVTNAYIDGCCIDMNIGHSNGGIIASNSTYRTVINNWTVKNSRRCSVGSFDQSDNAFAKITNGYAEGCFDGLGLIGTTNGEDMEVSNVTIKNCGPSVIGIDRSANTLLGKAKAWRIQATFIDSIVMFSGLSYSNVDITIIHSDSATITSTTTAAAATAAYAGRTNNFFSQYGGELTSLCTFFTCDNSLLKTRVLDGAASPIATKSCCKLSSNYGGPMLGNTYDIATEGGALGIVMDGRVHINNKGRLACKNWGSTYTGINIAPGTSSIDAAFPAGFEKSRNNNFVVDVQWDKGTDPGSNTMCVKANQQAAGCGWLTISGRCEVIATTLSGVYGFVQQGSAYKTRWDNVEAVSSVAGFTPFFMAGMAAAGEGRLNNWRGYPAPAAAGANWVAETASVTLPV